MTKANFYWLGFLPFRNGVDPEIRETDLAEPMQPHAWLMAQQPWPKTPTPAEIAARAPQVFRVSRKQAARFAKEAE